MSLIECGRARPEPQDGRTTIKPSWRVSVDSRCQFRQQSWAWRTCSSCTASRGRANRRSASLNACAGIRSRLWMTSSSGQSELGERMLPFALRSGRDRTKTSRVPLRITSKCKRSRSAVVRPCNVRRSRRWSGIRGSSFSKRGHDRIVRPSKRTNGRGLAAKWDAGHQTTLFAGSRPSRTRNDCSDSAMAWGGALRDASSHMTKLAPLSSNRPASRASLGPTCE